MIGNNKTYLKLLDKCEYIEDDKKSKANLEILKKSVARDNLSHAYLFYGNSLELLYRLALEFSASINCALNGCGSCRVCKNILKGIYANIKIVEADGNILTIDKIIELQRFMSMSSYSAGRKIGIIKEAEIMNAEASNRLLKILEEPPDDNCIFILLSRDLSSILPTILSRCMLMEWNFRSELGEEEKFDFSPLEALLKDGLLNLLDKKDGSSTESLNLSLEIIQLLDDLKKNINEMQKQEITRIKKMSKESEEARKNIKILNLKYERKLSKFDKLGMARVFDIMSTWLEDILVVKLGAERNLLNYKENYSFIKDRLKNASVDKVFNLFNVIERNRKSLNYSINKELCLDNIFLKIQGLNRF